MGSPGEQMPLREQLGEMIGARAGCPEFPIRQSIEGETNDFGQESCRSHSLSELFPRFRDGENDRPNHGGKGGMHFEKEKCKGELTDRRKV